MNTTDFNPCIAIPHFNHSQALPRVLAQLANSGIPIVIVDDGSAEAERTVAKESCLGRANVHFLQHQKNQGKGGAIITALQFAQGHGFSHALQLDADGQHNITDVPRFLAQAKATPAALILGSPQFGPDAPWERVQGRKLTKYMLWIESGSCEIQDGLCGFRVYPIHRVLETLKGCRISRRMGFDSEIIIRLIWGKTKIVNIPTMVSYPIDGISHFDYLRDNFEIVLMHMKLLVLGMLRAMGVYRTT